ncbi:MAG: transcriptional regulator PpsR [Rhodocyclaceae bacterium]|nr:transcriptional regulator PpsR [Rhodocyclaceae bacterium]
MDPSTAAALISAASDISLVLDDAGRVVRARLSRPDSQLEQAQNWVGRTLADVVSVECRDKVEALLDDARAGRARKWRHLNHPDRDGRTLPIEYSAIRLSDGQLLVFGRDLRSVTELQKRLVESHQAMERDYQRMRQMEARYRLLFETAPEPMLVVDASNRRILEANAAAERALGTQARKQSGRLLTDCFDSNERNGLDALMTSVLSAGRGDVARARLAGAGSETALAMTLFRHDNQSLFLVRLSQQGLVSTEGAEDNRALTLDALGASPDGFVVTDAGGIVVTANQAFADLCQVGHPNALLGESLDRWLGRSGVDLSVLLANLRQRGSVRLFATTLRGENGLQTQVEMSARAVDVRGRHYLSFSVRDVATRVEDQTTPDGLTRSASQLTELVGRVPLKDIVGETAELIEKLCIEAALDLTRDNRASAAEMLGLSRQSLYVKLRQYGLGDLGDRTDR